MADSRTSVVALNNTNFPTWKIQIKMALMKQGVWRIVDDTELPPDEDNFAAWNKYIDRRNKALATIVLAVETNLLYLLGSDPKDPVVVWEKLCDQFQKKTWSNKLILRRKLLSLKPKENESIQNHIKSMVETFEELSVIGEAVEEEDRVVHILASLPDKYNMLVTAFEACSEVPRLEVVTEKLLNEERKIREKTGGSFGDLAPTHDALLVNSFKSKFPKTCYYCGKVGHVQAICKEWKKKQEEEQAESKKPEVANFSHVRRSRGKVVNSDSSDDEVECIALVSEVHQENNKWVVDSAATYHMSNTRKQIRNLRRLKVKQRVKVGNGQYVEAKYEGTVKLRIRSGRRVRLFKLSNVLYVPELKYNLLSVAKASQAGKKVLFDHHGCEIINASTQEVLGSAMKVGNLYYVDLANKSDLRREKTGSVSRSDMERAIASITENNFKQDMMRRLSLVEEDKIRTDQRLSSVEEDINNSTSTIIKEETDQNQEDLQEEISINLVEKEMENNDIQEDTQEESQISGSNNFEDNSIRSKSSQESISDQVDVKNKVVGRNIRKKFSALKKRCSNILKISEVNAAN